MKLPEAVYCIEAQAFAGQDAYKLDMTTETVGTLSECCVEPAVPVVDLSVSPAPMRTRVPVPDGYDFELA